MNTQIQISIVLGTHNRLDQLKNCIESILRETRVSFKVYVTDAGSTDGTIDYLQEIASEKVIPILVGKKLGQAKAYNDVYSIVDTPYVCWLSDDNEVVNHGLDLALRILVSNPQIGLVALKTRDVQGPFVGTPYIGGISEAGILNVNQGMLPTHVLKEIGGFSEEFRDYGIDPALTADVLFAGYKVVYTKEVALHHFRNWSEDPASENYKWLQERHAASKKLYAQKYCGNSSDNGTSYRLKVRIAHKFKQLAQRTFGARATRQSALIRTLYNVLSGRYISVFDPFLSIGKDYHLVQALKKD